MPSGYFPRCAGSRIKPSLKIRAPSFGLCSASPLVFILLSVGEKVTLMDWMRPMFCAPGTTRPGLGKGGGSRQRENHRGNIERGLEDLSASRSLFVHVTPQEVSNMLPSVAGWFLIQVRKPSGAEAREEAA